MDQKLSDFKEDLQALVKQYWGEKDITYYTKDGVFYTNGKLIIIIEDYENRKGIC